MLEGIPKISVLVICYNQEKVISRAIESLLAQKDYIYEICVSDDCSKDRTWDILQEYSAKYPGLFVLHRNEPNVGIFENIEKTWTMPSGDMVYHLSGDDTCGGGWFKRVVDYIREERIDYKNEDFCIFGDYKAIYPNGDAMVFHNNLVSSGIDPIYLSLRTIVGNRSACYSINVLKQFEVVSQGRSHIAEAAQEIQLALFTDHFYYISHVGNIYYTGIGVSTKTSTDKFFEERQQIVPYALSFLEKKGVSIDPEFYVYMEANLAEKTFINRKTIKNFFKFIVLKFRSYDKRIGFKSTGLKLMWISLVRRLPHKKPLTFNF